MHFETPLALLLLVFTPLLMEASAFKSKLLPQWLARRVHEQNYFHFSTPVALQQFSNSFRTKNRNALLSTLRVASFILLVTALARPQTGTSYSEIDSSGRDIMLALDTSGSMEAVDFFIDDKRVTRLEALKKVTKDFIVARKTDRIGMVIFGESAFTQSPLTLDHHTLEQFIDSIEAGMAGKSTAIGDAIAVSLKRIKDIPAESKVIVLVTDGKSNVGSLQPLEAAQVAKTLGTKIYAVGIGGEGLAPFVTETFFGMKQLVNRQLEYDEKTLVSIAEITGGKYFAAQDTAKLQSIFAEIDKLEERPEKTFEHVEYEEQFLPFVLAASLLLLLAEIACASIFFKIP